jgi:hypothetical protein
LTHLITPRWPPAQQSSATALFLLLGFVTPSYTLIACEVAFHSTYCNLLHFVTSCSFYSVCVSLWSQRSCSITYVTFKVMYIGRANYVIFTCLLLPLSVVLHWERNVGLWTETDGCYRMARVSVNRGYPNFLQQRSTPVIVAGGKITGGVRYRPNSCWLCSRVGDPCHKRNRIWYNTVVHEPH